MAKPGNRAEWLWPTTQQAASLLNGSAPSSDTTRGLRREANAAWKRLKEHLTGDKREWLDEVRRTLRLRKDLRLSSGKRPQALSELETRLWNSALQRAWRPLSEWQQKTAEVESAVALVRIRAALSLEARDLAENEGRLFCEEADRQAMLHLNTNVNQFHHPPFPRLLHIYANRQILSWLVDSPEARVGLLRAEVWPTISGDSLTFLKERAASLHRLGGEARLLRLALADIAEPEVRDIVVASVMGYGRGATEASKRRSTDSIAAEFLRRLMLPEEGKLLEVLVAYWGHLNGRDKVFLGFCWACGRFFAQRRRAKTCGARCRKVLERTREQSERRYREASSKRVAINLDEIASEP
jgi:hypothetical protein